MEEGGLPLGFGMALAQNDAAMRRFTAMTEAEQNSVIRRAHTVQSREEMQRLVSDLAQAETERRDRRGETM